MRELKIGHSIRTHDGSFSEVYSFGHRDHDAVGIFDWSAMATKRKSLRSRQPLNRRLASKTKSCGESRKRKGVCGGGARIHGQRRRVCNEIGTSEASCDDKGSTISFGCLWRPIWYYQRRLLRYWLL